MEGQGCLLDEDVCLCIECTEVVIDGDQSLMCNGCDRWQHLGCNTGVTKREYRRAIRQNTELDWQCAEYPKCEQLKV
jgi:hypothetical protein